MVLFDKVEPVFNRKNSARILPLLKWCEQVTILTDNNIIERVGSNKKGYWEILK